MMASAGHPRLTIVTPSYNQGAFISRTIESVLSQAGAFEIEYFVMDGGSTDDSTRIIAEFAARVAAGTWPVQCAGISMEWVSRPDRGQTDALNQGLRRATGDIIGWINSDDTYVPGAFARVAAAFARESDADIIYGDGEVIDEHDRVQWVWLSRPYRFGVLTTYHFLWNEFTNYVMQQSTFWRRSVMSRIGYPDEAFHYGMDIEYWIRAGAAGLRLRHIPELIGRFRLIEGTKSLSSLTAFWPDYLEIFRRYRGVKRLGRFFAFYYFNLARQYEFDVTESAAAGTAILHRWDNLPGAERALLANRAALGFRLGCLLSARELLSRGDATRAAQFVAAAGHISWRDRLHPFAWPYGVRRWLPDRISAAIESVAAAGIAAWRRRVYDYRYHESARTQLTPTGVS